MFIRLNVHRIETLKNEKHSACGIEQNSSIILFFQIQLLISLIILFFYGVIKYQPYLLILAIYRILKQIAHRFFCLIKLFSLLYPCLGL